jgi:RNA polymerase sigma-70 factor (ECF subfamily)
MRTPNELAPPPAVDGISDRSLLRRLRGGSQDAAAQLYRRYARRLEALARAKTPAELARRVDAEDIVQSVFSSFFRGASRGCYDVPDGEELWGLLLVIALNKIRAKGSFHRAAKRDVRATAGGRLLEPGGPAEPAGQTTEGFLRLVVDEVLERLPAERRQMVALRIEGHEVAEIAEQTRRSKRSVERVLQDFRRELAGALESGD